MLVINRRNNTFSGVSPPGFNGLTANLECGYLGQKASWSTKSGDRRVKTGGTSPLGLILEFRILRCPFKSLVGHVAFALRHPNFVNLYNIERHAVAAKAFKWQT